MILITLFTAVLSFLYLAPTAINRVDIETGPYLQYCNDSSMYVMAVAKTRGELQVKYWQDKDTNIASTNFIKKLRTFTSNRFAHRILLKGLKPGEKYHYRIENSMDENIYEFHFHDAHQENFKFIAMGDPQGNTGVFTALSKKIRKKGPAFVLFLGDICHSPHYSDFKKEFFIPETMKLISEIPFFNTCGNHERWGRTTKALFQPPFESKEDYPYYSFDHGQAHFVVLNSEIDLDYGGKQYNFLIDDLMENNQKWTILVFHKPAYVSGGTGTERNFRKMFPGLAEKFDIDLVLNGHSHFLQHNYVDGIHHIISGGGGGPEHTPGSGEETLFSVVDHHFLEIYIDSESIDISAINKSDSLIYNYSIKK